MKKGLLILLLSIFFLGSFVPGSNLAELAKVPNLIWHYFDYQNESAEEVNFISFLQLHYGLGIAASQHRSHDHQKERLPLISSHFMVKYFIAQTIRIEGLANPAIEVICWNLSYAYFYKYQFNSSFFTPPKA